ncbi:hypothetical protein O5D80_005494 [Batrachochytrium dendrobatidis]|nr:hypothetical protein O5D80_005494 [Batrachochytrium dendrobatidis]
MQFTIVAFITALVACVAATPSPRIAPPSCSVDAECLAGQRCKIAEGQTTGFCVDE